MTGGAGWLCDSCSLRAEVSLSKIPKTEILLMPHHWCVSVCATTPDEHVAPCNVVTTTSVKNV